MPLKIFVLCNRTILVWEGSYCTIGHSIHCWLNGVTIFHPTNNIIDLENTNNIFIYFFYLLYYILCHQKMGVVNVYVCLLCVYRIEIAMRPSSKLCYFVDHIKIWHIFTSLSWVFSKCVDRNIFYLYACAK